MESSLNEWIGEITDVLNIGGVNIEYADTLPTDTMMTAYVPSDQVVYVKKGLNSFLDIVFAITHELRHVYQHRKGLLHSYKARENIDVESYNNQELEVDAHAFALLMIERYLGVTPDSPQLNTKEILQRKKELQNIYISSNH